MPHQLPVLTADSRFKLLACGRRWGKTAIGLVSVLIGHGPRRGKYRGAVDGGRIWWIVPTYPIASEVWRDLSRSVGDCAVKRSEVERRIELPGGGSVMVKSADNPDSLRGAGLDGVVIDEAAFCPADVWHKAIPPTIADRMGWAMLLSTPNGFNWFQELFDAASTDKDWAVFQRPTADNPLIRPTELERLKRGMPIAAYLQEHEARFTAVSGAEFPAEYFDDSIWCDEWPENAAATVVALDPSKGRNAKRGDYSAAVACGFYDGRLYVDASLERVPVVQAVDNTLSLAFRHRAKAVIYEANNFQEEAVGPVFAQRLEGNRLHGLRVIPVTHTTNKEGRIQSLDPYLRNGTLRFMRTPGCKLLVDQLREFPMAKHDDGPDALETAIGHCLALLNYDRSRGVTAADVLRQRGFV